MASSQFGSFERRPIASTMSSAETSSPSIVRTPVTCGIPFAADGPVNRPTTQAPRRTGRSLSATLATAYSIAGRRPVIVMNRSSPSRGVRSVIDRGHSRKHVERYAADPEQSLFHVWQMGIEEMAYRRVQVVRLPELSDPSPFPRLPRFLWRAG